MASSSSPSSSSSALKRTYWTPEEDEILIQHVDKHGAKDWNKLAQHAQESGLQRDGSSCRCRWMNHLNPELGTGSYTEKEDEEILRLHDEGYGWSQIAKKLPGRTDNGIKNRYNGELKKRKAVEEPKNHCNDHLKKKKVVEQESLSFFFDDIPDYVCDYSNSKNEESQSLPHENLDVEDYGVSQCVWEYGSTSDYGTLEVKDYSVPEYVWDYGNTRDYSTSDEDVRILEDQESQNFLDEIFDVKDDDNNNNHPLN